MRLLVFFLLVVSSPVFAADMVKVDIVRVKDGDTVKALVEGKEIDIKLLDVDCYETSKNRRAYWQTDYYNKSLEDVLKQGNESKEILQRLINENRGNIYLLAKRKDRYRRTLGLLYVGNDKQNINDYMLTSGKCEDYRPLTKKKP